MSEAAESLMGKVFGEKIRSLREARGLSQERLGGAAGTTRETIRQIEKGHVPRIALIYSLAAALETNLWDLLPPDAEGFQRGPEDERGGDSSSKHRHPVSAAA